MTLTNFAGTRFILKNVCYVPESQDQILSIMKFRTKHKANFYFMSLEKVHSDVYEQDLESKGNSIYTLIFLDKFTH